MRVVQLAAHALAHRLQEKRAARAQAASAWPTVIWIIGCSRSNVGIARGVLAPASSPNVSRHVRDIPNATAASPRRTAGPGDAVERRVLEQRRGLREHGALGRHEHVLHREVVRAGAAHPARVPGVEQLGLADRHEHVARLGRRHPPAHLTVLDDLRVRGHPRGVPAAGAEALAAGGVTR
jgi:hypothetical protein